MNRYQRGWSTTSILALVVVVASPASPDAPEADLTGAENLTRAQVDAIVRAAVDTLG